MMDILIIGGEKRVTAEENFLRELADHLATWGPHCGAPQSVYEGHLRALLRAHAEYVNTRGERGEEIVTLPGHEIAYNGG